MKRIVLVLTVAAALAFAGCLGSGGSDGGSATGADAGNGSGSGGPGQTGDSGGGDGGAGTTSDHWNATLSEAPAWKPGYWWTAKVTDAYKDTSYTVKFVVASQHGSSYDVGLAEGDFKDPVVIAHWPPVGELGTDLSYSIHNEIFKPVKFPLEEGNTWETTYLGTQSVTAEVKSVDGMKAEIVMTTEDNDTISLTYDAEMETITKLEDNLGLTYEVTDHGHGYTGDVVVPHGKSQYISGRIAGALDFTFGPAPPTGSVSVSEPQASAAVVAGSGTIRGTSPPGIYRETATTPGGNSTTLQTTGTSGLEVKYLRTSSAKGTWQFRHVAGGFGAAATEIIAYEQLTVTLADEPASGSTSAS